MKWFQAKKILASIIIFLPLSHLHSAEEWNDFKDSLQLIAHGSYRQFTSPTGLGLFTVGTASTLYTLSQDEKWSASAVDQGPTTFESRLSNDWSQLTNFPTIPLAFYFVAKKTGDQKMKQFAIETFSTMYLVMIEALGLSFIPIHDRPREQKLSAWETSFRSTSSFPSGHILGLAALSFKTLEYYGPWWSLIPSSALAIISLERVKSGKHYPSDVIGGLFLAAMASEGVSLANQKNPHSALGHWQNDHQARLLIYPTAHCPSFLLAFNY